MEVGDKEVGGGDVEGAAEALGCAGGAELEVVVGVGGVDMGENGGGCDGDVVWYGCLLDGDTIDEECVVLVEVAFESEGEEAPGGGGGGEGEG